MKYLMVVGDGMGDYPCEELGGKTPLQAAYHPNMNRLAQRGLCGKVRTIPKGLSSNTDVAILSILGYDPKKYHIGRGPLEAASIGVKLGERDVAFRCNLITEEGGVLQDYSAGHIETNDAIVLIDALNEKLGEDKVKFYPGISYRHILVLRDDYSEFIRCYPAHNVIGKRIMNMRMEAKIPEAESTAEYLNKLIEKSYSVLTEHPLNQKREKTGKPQANMIWLWGPGRKPQMQSLREKNGLSSAVISAVDVINGMGVYVGMNIIKVPGATGFIDTNYEGKADYALEALKHHDFVLVHVEAPDEVGHLGDAQLKKRTIEDLDRRLLGRILNRIDNDYTIAILSDHLTPILIRTHTDEPVPFLFYNSRSNKTGQGSFDEVSASNSQMIIEEGYRFFETFLNYGKA